MLQLQSAMYRCRKYILPHPYIGLTRRIIVNLQHAGVAYCIGSTMFPCQTFHTVCNIAYLPMSNHRRRRRRRGNSGSDKSNCNFTAVSGSVNLSTKIVNNLLKLQKHRSRLDLRQHFFGERIINVWNKLDGNTVTATTLNCFKRHLETLHKDESFSY